MPFATLLEQTIRASASQNNILTDGQFTVTYAELPELLTTLDDYLAHQGIERNRCLALECPNSIPGVITLLYLLQQERNFVLLPPSEQGEQPSQWKPIPRFCHYRLVVQRAPATAAAEWMRAPENFLLLEANHACQPPADSALYLPGHLFLRTSGSMGASKLVVHEHEKLIGNVRNCAQKYGFTHTDRVLIPIPIAHMYGLGAEFLPAVMAGAAIDLQDKMTYFKYLERERLFQPTIAFVTPILCDMLLKVFKTQRTGYKLIVTSGQRISEELFRAFDEQVGGCLVNQYGSSEMGAIAACDPTDPQDLRATTIGKPMPNVQLTIDAGKGGALGHDPEVEVAQAGELFCQHPYGFLGYVDEEGVWLRQAASDGWYSTGDLAGLLPNGCLQVMGRAGHSVNRRGYLVQLAEIEQRMEGIQDVAQVVVVRAQGESAQGERIAAFCVLNQPATLTDLQIRKHCFAHLPAYAVPDDIFVLDTLPLLPSGKVDRQGLMALAK